MIKYPSSASFCTRFQLFTLLSLTSVTIMYQFFTSVIIWYQFFTCVSIWYQFFTRVSFDTIFSHVMIWYQFSKMWFFLYRFFTRVVSNWHWFFTFVKIWYQFFTSEKNSRTCSSHVKNIKLWNLSTIFTPQKLSKLTLRKFHICQKWRIGANSSHCAKFTKCENCGSTML